MVTKEIATAARQLTIPELTRGSFAYRPGHLWRRVQAIFRHRYGRGRGLLVRIARPDGSCNYTAPGSYEVNLSDGTPFTVIVLE